MSKGLSRRKSGKAAARLKGFFRGVATTAEGIHPKGNFVWSTMDSLEWTAGYRTRFGVMHAC